ncbi:hypothetical protein ACJX0J_025129, partial [Zea mays]
WIEDYKLEAKKLPQKKLFVTTTSIENIVNHKDIANFNFNKKHANIGNSNVIFFCARICLLSLFNVNEYNGNI